MIFCTVGTTDFDALVQALDELAPELDERIVCQIGRGSYEPVNCEWFRLAPSLDPYYEQANLVVAHGGLGTLIEVMQRRLPLVGLSNPDRYDRHQDDLLSTWGAAGHLVWCQEINDLARAIAQARQRQFAPYEAPPCHIAKEIRRFLGLSS